MGTGDSIVNCIFWPKLHVSWKIWIQEKTCTGHFRSETNWERQTLQFRTRVWRSEWQKVGRALPNCSKIISHSSRWPYFFAKKYQERSCIMEDSPLEITCSIYLMRPEMQPAYVTTVPGILRKIIKVPCIRLTNPLLKVGHGEERAFQWAVSYKCRAVLWEKWIFD